MASAMWFTTAGLAKSSTSCWRLSVRFRPGTPIAQSGCARNRSESGLTISGSIHSPNSRPSALTSRASPSSPCGSLRSLTTQSPSERSSLSRRPNQPSSRTNSSMPIALAARAIATMRSWSKSKYVPSQLLSSTGRGRSRHSPRAMRWRKSPWRASLMPPRPASLQASSASGVVKLSPGFSGHAKCSGLTPMRTRVVPKWPTSASARKLPDQASAMPQHSPVASVVAGRRSARNGLCSLPDPPRRLLTPCRPGTSARSCGNRSRAHVPDSVTRCQSSSGRSSVALIAHCTTTGCSPPFAIRMDRATIGWSRNSVNARVTVTPVGSSRRSISSVSASPSSST